MFTRFYLFAFIALVGMAWLTPHLSSKPSQILKTRLQITIRNELGNIVEGAKVQLYASKADYDASKNAVTETKLTNKKGEVNFDELEKAVYFVNAEKGSANNYNAGVQTDTLKPNRINKVTIVISD